MDIDIRATAPDEARAAANVVADALILPRLTDEEWVGREQGWIDHHSLTAWDGQHCIGHVSAFEFDITVPGGARVAMAGITRIGILPTYTRRGLLTNMMRRLLIEARERGQIIATLRASEAVIYQRFGFEVAGESAAITVTTRDAGPVQSPAPGSFRILHESNVAEVVPALYDRVARRRAGTVSRDAFFITRVFGDAISRKQPHFVVVHTDPSGLDDGYALYDVKWDESVGGAYGIGTVHDLFGIDAAVERALWGHLLRVDLIRTWKADNRPIDDPLRFAVRDQRAVKLRDRWDEQWTRLLDVDAALAARTYGAGQRGVTVQVADPVFADNTGAWSVSAAGASRTSAAPDLEVSIGTLSAAYFGGTSWRDLADAGKVTEHSAGAIEAADLLFAQRPAPFCGTFF